VIKVEALPGPAPGSSSALPAESGAGASEGNGKNGNSGPGDAQGRARRNPKEEVADRVPLIKRALDVFGATIKNVDEGFGAEPSPSEAPVTAAEPESWDGAEGVIEEEG